MRQVLGRAEQDFDLENMTRSVSISTEIAQWINRRPRPGGGFLQGNVGCADSLDAPTNAENLATPETKERPHSTASHRRNHVLPNRLVRWHSLVPRTFRRNHFGLRQRAPTVQDQQLAMFEEVTTVEKSSRSPRRSLRSSERPALASPAEHEPRERAVQTRDEVTHVERDEAERDTSE